MRKRTIICLLFIGMSITSCNDWLNVDPKSQVKEDLLFRSEAGFRDALIGVYTIMGRDHLYGGYATMLVPEVLAQTYSTVNTRSYSTCNIQTLMTYDYEASRVRGFFNQIWSSSYYAITNCNHILRNVDEQRGIIRDGIYELVKGEAIALRAFLHFDLLRAFAPSMITGANQPAIPFVDRVTNTPIAQSSVEELLNRIISELETARALVKEVDPIGPHFDLYADEPDAYSTEDYILDEGFTLYRKSRLNYYGMTALLARVCLYKNDKANALRYAKEVIDSRKFTLVTSANVSTSGLLRAMTRYEYISSVYVYNLAENRSENYFRDYISSSEESYELYISDARRISIFGSLGVDIDLRSQQLFLPYYVDLPNKYISKYMSGNRIPLLKLSEMYLIAAECSNDISYLQTLLNSRGYVNNPLPANADLAQEIQNEYQREFIAEGQLFYFYKRINLSLLPFTATTMNNSAYIFPMPDNEIEFGNIQH